jgi:tagatose-1,6-bisphosphate aldolase
MLALDQRGSLRKMIISEEPVSYARQAAIKEALIRVISPHASATLLDPEIGYPACVASDALSGQSGLLLAIEESGYEGDPTERRTRLLPDWSVEKTRLAGASGIKLLVYYHPDAPNAASQEELVTEVAAECRRWELPLFLEPLHYSLQAGVKTVANAERRRVVIETARRLVPLGVTVLKAEFPVDVKQTGDLAEWADACAELSTASAVPWVLLSAGVDYDTFLRQVEIACRSGSSGVLCGRAVWKEAVNLPGGEQTGFLYSVAVPRMQRLRQTVSALARPLTDFYPAGPGDDLEGWYRR